MSKEVKDVIHVENARIVFRNFSGKEGQYNNAGNRNFCVLFDADTAKELADIGWKISYLKPREEDEEPQAYMEVRVAFGSYPPQIMLISGQGKTSLDEESVDILDWTDLKNVDLVIRPYNWEVNGKTGVKAYLKAGYFTIEEDRFASKYYDVPDTARNIFEEEE